MQTFRSPWRGREVGKVYKRINIIVDTSANLELLPQLLQNLDKKVGAFGHVRKKEFLHSFLIIIM